MKLSYHFVVYIVLLMASFAYAHEPDNFTQRYQPLDDSRQIMNSEVNRKFQIALEDLNKKKAKNCNSDKIHAAIKEIMNTSLPSIIDPRIENNSKVKKHQADKENIFSKISNKDKLLYTPAMITTKLNSSINLHGYYIGLDKINYFFEEGRSVYDSYRTSGRNSSDERIDDALKVVENLEDGVYGLTTTGVKSYADITSAYAGFLFWSRLTDGANPYFTCADGQWKQTRFFDWAEHVNSGWDEAINCSTYAKPSIADAVKKQAQKLVSDYSIKGKNYRFECPVSAIECQTLKKQYGRLASRLLGPECLNANPGADDKSANIFSGQKASGVSGNAQPAKIELQKAEQQK